MFEVHGGEGRTMYSKLFSSKMSKCSFILKASETTESLDPSCTAALQLHEIFFFPPSQHCTIFAFSSLSPISLCKAVIADIGLANYELHS